jgi:hypothetical protein
LEVGLLGEMMEGEFVLFLFVAVDRQRHCHSYCLKQYK